MRNLRITSETPVSDSNKKKSKLSSDSTLPVALEIGEKRKVDWGDSKPKVGSAFVTKSGKAYKVEKDFSIIRIR